MTNIIGGLQVANLQVATFQYDEDGNTWISNIDITSDANIAAMNIQVTDIITTGNIDVGGSFSVQDSFNAVNFTASGNIVGDRLEIDGLANVGALRSDTSVISPIITADQLITNSISIASGLTFTGNLTVNSLTTPTGNIGNIQLSGNTVYSSSGNLTIEPHPPGVGGTIYLSGNTNSAGTIYSTGNVTAPYFFGNGSLLTGISGIGGLGVGQTWSVISGRALNTTYTNTSSSPIAVSVAVQGISGGSPVVAQAFVGSVMVGMSQLSSNTSTPISTLFFIVPAGATYSVADSVSGHSIYNWAELS